MAEKSAQGSATEPQWCDLDPAVAQNAALTRGMRHAYSISYIE